MDKTIEELKQQLERCETLEEKINCEHALKNALFDAFTQGRVEVRPKIEFKEPKEIYTDDELRYAAYARCDCGAGLAYPKGLSFHDCSAWDCSDILTGRAQPGTKHSDKYPFAFYEIRSEDQPSVKGATTRPMAVEADSEVSQ